MARLEDLPPSTSEHLEKLECPTYNTSPWVTGPALHQRKVALISTAGLLKRGDRPFTFLPGDHYRIIPSDVQGRDLVMSHVSANFDRSGFCRDWNVAFPLERLKELCEEGLIGSVADHHYSFMGATDPAQFEAAAREVGRAMKAEGVDAALLLPV